MAIVGIAEKQPGETLDYDLLAGEWLSDDDFILSAVTTAPAGITVISTTVMSGGRSVKLWVSGGTSGVTYKLETTMTTDDGRVKQAELKVKVKEV